MLWKCKKDQGDMIICILVAAKAVRDQPRPLLHVRHSTEHLCLVEEGTLSRVFGEIRRTVREVSLRDKIFMLNMMEHLDRKLWNWLLLIAIKCNE